MGSKVTWYLFFQSVIIIGVRQFQLYLTEVYFLDALVLAGGNKNAGKT